MTSGATAIFAVARAKTVENEMVKVAPVVRAFQGPQQMSLSPIPVVPSLRYAFAY